MDLRTIEINLSDRRSGNLHNVVGKLETAVAAGLVPNVLFNDAKDIINRAVDESTETFLKGGPHAQKHSQSDWWLAVYAANAFVSGAHGLPAALKRAQKANIKEYAAFLSSLLPLRELLEAAKPMIVKKQHLPKPAPTPEQAAREAATMTCQCCGSKFLANTGKMAHHGYERPGYGYQTASCMGARHLPFEVDRSQLGRLIDALKEHRVRMIDHRHALTAETVAITREWEIGRWNDRKRQSFDFTRENFESEDGKAARKAIGFYGDFDELKTKELTHQDRRIDSISQDIKGQQSRYDGWKQTHQWVAGEWRKV
jgi:hypothetical protein